ncbi:DDE-type integrase/transposase/recombinase [Phenylobacterium sp.]|uniref:DDE-type integrase/transposase/recombinase n=1 Tax=Phenylobacterium sp. TaxID=1871053 RepID=UPI0039833631
MTRSANPLRYFDSSSKVIRLVVLKSYVTKTRDKAATLTFIKPAMKQIGSTDRQEVGRWLNNRAENSHQPLRRRQRAMERFRRMKTRHKFGAVHGTVHNHFNQQRHLISRNLYRERCERFVPGHPHHPQICAITCAAHCPSRSASRASQGPRHHAAT